MRATLVALVVTEHYVRNGSIFGYSAISGCVVIDCAIYAASSSSVIWYCVMRVVQL